MASFYDNLRASNTLPTRGDLQKSNNNLSITNTLPTRGSITKERQQQWRIDKAHAEAEQRWIDKQVNDSADLREEIKNLSGGKVIVDKSIYNRTELERIRDTVQKMKDYNNGVLFPGYTVISNSDGFDEELTTGLFKSGDRLNNSGFATFPNGYYGTKNNPYRIYLKNANDPKANDFAYGSNFDGGWHPKSDENNQDATHTHELAHSAHREALKKSHAPTLWMSDEEDRAYKNLKSKYNSFRDLVQKLADENAFKDTGELASNVSRYAASRSDTDKNNKAFPYPEMFAEAYTDVLYNGDNASSTSKKLVEAYADYLNEYNNIFGNEIDRIRRQFNNSSNNFVNNLRNSVPKLGNG